MNGSTNILSAVARGLVVGGVVLVGLAAGCSRGPEFAEVEGVVTLDGKPLDSVEIVFLPDPEKGNKGPRASAYTDEQGRYKLRCEQADKDGAVVGPHRVCVIDITAVTMLANMPGLRAPGPLAEPLGSPEKPKAARVPATYSSAAQTPFHVEVKPGPQTHNFDVRSGRRR